MRIKSPYGEDGYEWLRGNLHAHTTRSDGTLAPEQVIAAYERLSYDFLAISDHDLLVPPSEFQSTTGMTLIPADEITRGGPHILAVGLRRVVTPHADRQEAIRETVAQGGFAILNHPNWQKHFNHFPQELMVELQGYVGIEIYNGVIERLEGTALALDRWDRLLSLGRRVWGYAHDDSHRSGDIGRGWNVVQAADRSAEAICKALEHGRFYASTGVTITEIRVDGRSLSVTAPNAQRIRFVGGWGRELAYVDTAEAVYRFTGDEGEYVRAECYGEGTRAAWLQPIFFPG